MIKKLPTYHVIILAKNDVGRVNLYRLVSIPTSELFCQNGPGFPRASCRSTGKG